MAPIDNHALLTSVMYSQWNWLLLLIALVVRSLVAPVGVLAMIAAPLLIWSHPLSLALVSVAAMGLARRRRGSGSNVAFHGVVILAAATYWLWGIDRSASPEGQPAGLLAGVWQAVELFAWRVVPDAWLGPGLRASAATVGDSGWLATVVVAGGGATAGWWLARRIVKRGAARGVTVAACTMVCVFVHAGVVTSRGAVLATGDLWNQRYAYLQSIGWLVLVLRWTASIGAAPRRLAVAGVLLAVSCAAAGSNRHLWQPDVAGSKALRGFLAEVADAERELPPGEHEFVFHRPGWDIQWKVVVR